MTQDSVIALAIDRVSNGDESGDVLELASILPDQHYKIPEVLHRLAQRDAKCSSEKWLFLLLAWLYENRDAVEDPLGLIEELYADFDYPKEIESFVRYMPPEDPSRVSERYLIDAWRKYLESAARRYRTGAT